MVHAPIFLAALLAAAPAPEPGLPTRAEVRAALNALEACRGLTGPECPPPYRVYRIHAAACMRIAPEGGREAVACRVDLSLLYPDPARNTRHRDSCSRFVRRSGGGRAWESILIRDRPCEMPSRLARDPHPLPDRSQLARALVAMLTCYDMDGTTDCGPQPSAARVTAWRCRPLAPAADGRARAACRVTASVAYGRLFGARPLTNVCVRLQRYTRADEEPVVWGAAHVPDEGPCEA